MLMKVSLCSLKLTQDLHLGCATCIKKKILKSSGHSLKVIKKKSVLFNDIHIYLNVHGAICSADLSSGTQGSIPSAACCCVTHWIIRHILSL